MIDKSVPHGSVIMVKRDMKVYPRYTMPEGFFIWYAGEMLKSLLPVLGIMLCLIIAWFKVGRKEA